MGPGSAQTPYLCSPDHWLSISGASLTGLPAKSSPTLPPLGSGRPQPPDGSSWRRATLSVCPSAAGEPLCSPSPPKGPRDPARQTPLLLVGSSDPPTDGSPGKSQRVCVLSTPSPDGRGHSTQSHMAGQTKQGQAPTHAGFRGAPGAPSAPRVPAPALEALCTAVRQSLALLCWRGAGVGLGVSCEASDHQC